MAKKEPGKVSPDNSFRLTQSGTMMTGVAV